MVKRKKKAETPSEEKPKAKKVKKANKEKSPKKSSSGSKHWGLLTKMLPGIVGSVLAILLCAGFSYYSLILKGGQAVSQQYGDAKASSYMHYLEQKADLLHQTAQEVASDPNIRQLMQSGETAVLDKISKRLKRRLPFAVNVTFFPLKQAKKDDNANPPVSYAQLDLIRRAEKQESPLPEIHIRGQKQYLNAVAAIKAGDDVIGTALFNFDFHKIKQLFPQLAPNEGYIEILQRFGSNKPLTVFNTGNGNLKNGEGIRVLGEAPHWETFFYAAPAINVMQQKATLVLTVAGVAILLVIAFSFLSVFLLRRSMTINATSLTTAFRALTTKQKPEAHYSLDVFASLAGTIERLFHDYDAQMRHQVMKSQGHGTAQNADAQPPDEEHVLDIDISDEDSSLMGGDEVEPEPHSPAKEPLDIDEPDDLMDLDMLEMADDDDAAMTGVEDESVAADIFRAYDIRGVVEQTLTETTAQHIGMAIGSEAKDQGQEAVIVARDGRESSPKLAEALVNGIMYSGLKVIDIGMVPTPLLYFATHTMQTQSGVVVTGSHNPPQYNGFKIVIAGKTLANEKIQALRERIEAGNLSQGQGSYEHYNVTQDYEDRVLNDVVLAKPMKVVVDCGNGVTGPVGPQLLEKLGCTVTTLYGDVDGTFPNHHPDPSKPENLQSLIEAVQSEGAELGIAFDGDGDRLGIVTPSGKIIWPDRILMAYAKDLLSRNPGADVLYDVKCTRDVAELVSSMGGRAIMSATGHSLMKAKMAETGAVVGGELSGHLFFNDRWYGFDDAMYSAARLLEILSMEPMGADDVFAELPEKHSTAELQIPATEANKFKLIESLANQGEFNNGNIIDLDGLRVEFPDAWGLVRASNTTPNLVLRFEGDTEEALEQVKSLFKAQLLAVDSSLQISF